MVLSGEWHPQACSMDLAPDTISFVQVCEKQCRDENGFKCHTMSENHLRQMLVVGESAGKHIEGYSSQFQSEFVAMLSRRYVLLPLSTPYREMMLSLLRHD